ncbi:MAG: hypothetical protein JRC91_14445 [Deltaproteobacteria bacterium]|nr:hypothetical protein [Deltaproteobacteria bacterium]
MIPSTIIGFVNNAALLLGLGLLYDILTLRQVGEKTSFNQLVTGVILGAIGIAVMSTPWEFIPGVIFDTRSILLCITGFFFGTLPVRPEKCVNKGVVCPWHNRSWFDASLDINPDVARSQRGSPQNNPSGISNLSCWNGTFRSTDEKPACK